MKSTFACVHKLFISQVGSNRNVETEDVTSLFSNEIRLEEEKIYQ